MTQKEATNRLYTSLRDLGNVIYTEQLTNIKTIGAEMEKALQTLNAIRDSSFLNLNNNPLIQIEEVEVKGYEWSGIIYKYQDNEDDTFYKVYGDIDVRKDELGTVIATVGTICCDDLGFKKSSIDLNDLNLEIEKKFDYVNDGIPTKPEYD